MSKPLVFVSGPYRAPSESGVFTNIINARAAAIEIWKAGGVAVCPHLNTAFMGGLMSDDTWLEGDLEMLRRCDGLHLIEGWELSVGAGKESVFAHSEGISRHFYNEWRSLSDWIASLTNRWEKRA